MPLAIRFQSSDGRGYDFARDAQEIEQIDLVTTAVAAVKTVSNSVPVALLVLGSNTVPSSFGVPASMGEGNGVSGGGVVVPPATATVTKLDCLLITSAT